MGQKVSPPRGGGAVAPAPDLAARARLDAIEGKTGASVIIGGGISALDTGAWLVNNTGAAIPVPTSRNQADLVAAGFSVVSGATQLNEEEFDEILTAADTTLQTDSDGALGKTNSGQVMARVPTGLPVGAERKFARVGVNDMIISIGDGTVEIIDAQPDGQVALNANGVCVVKKTGATTWETVFASADAASAAAASGGEFYENLLASPPASPGLGAVWIPQDSSTNTFVRTSFAGWLDINA